MSAAKSECQVIIAGGLVQSQSIDCLLRQTWHCLDVFAVCPWWCHVRRHIDLPTTDVYHRDHLYRRFSSQLYTNWRYFLLTSSQADNYKSWLTPASPPFPHPNAAQLHIQRITSHVRTNTHPVTFVMHVQPHGTTIHTHTRIWARRKGAFLKLFFSAGPLVPDPLF